MRIRMMFALALSLGIASGAIAQDADRGFHGYTGSPVNSLIKVNGEFLLWWLKGNDIPPLINSARGGGDLAANLEAGGLSDPNAFTVYGGNSYSTGPLPGFRLGLTVSEDECNSLSFSVGGFYLTPRVNKFHIASDAAGNPPIILTLREVFFPGTGAEVVETGGVFAGPFSAVPEGFLTGQATARSSISMWGAEANTGLGMGATDNLSLVLLAGFRYIGMQDTLTIDASVTNAGNGTISDRFSVDNQFYGGQIGARLCANMDRLCAVLTSRVALGNTYQRYRISGSHVLPQGVPDDGAPGGFYAVAANLGNSTRNAFTVVPDVNLTLAYALLDNLAVSVGYTFLYWSDVGRSGDQIDRNNYNSGLNPVFGAGTDRSGPRVPARLDKSTDFWAQGLNFGIHMRY